MVFDKYVQKELVESVSLNENIQEYGWTSTCKAKPPFVAAHKHTYYMTSNGFGWTGPASDGNAHIHEIINGKVVMDGDGHTHDLDKAEKKGSDAVEGVDSTQVLMNPIKGSLDK